MWALSGWCSTWATTTRLWAMSWSATPNCGCILPASTAGTRSSTGWPRTAARTRKHCSHRYSSCPCSTCWWRELSRVSPISSACPKYATCLCSLSEVPVATGCRDWPSCTMTITGLRKSGSSACIFSVTVLLLWLGSSSVDCSNLGGVMRTRVRGMKGIRWRIRGCQLGTMCMSY